MSDLTTSQLIKIILGIFVVAFVIGGFIFYFKEQIIDFFKNLPSGKIILSVI
jgi:ATP/ADP translocase